MPLAPIHADPTRVQYRPSLFFGIGGVGGRVLSNLRRRLDQHFGGGSELPSLPMLYLDSDPTAIATARSGCRLEDHETLTISLRDPRYYRSKYPTILEWLSRRWLFNIPRSHQVEGIRPLGRLVMADHHEPIRDRVRQMIQSATARDSLATMRATTHLDFEAGPPAIYIVASMNGGTGSGGCTGPRLPPAIHLHGVGTETRCDHRLASPRDQRTGPTVRDPDGKCRGMHPGTAALWNARTGLPRRYGLSAAGIPGRSVRPHVLRPPGRRVERRGLLRRDGKTRRVPVSRHGDSGPRVLRSVPPFRCGA